MDVPLGKRAAEDKETIERLSERIAWLQALNELQALRLRRLESQSRTPPDQELQELPQNGSARRPSQD